MSDLEGPRRAKHARYNEGDEIPIDEREDYGKEEVESEYKSKHTLDSDEEEEIKYRKLDMSKVEGQEEAGEEVKEESNIMAFNMKEDLEEGHFDSEGNFIYDKKEKEIKDAWLDNIDWANVKNAAGDQWKKLQDDSDESEQIINDLSESQLKNIYEKIASVLRPGETIEKALRRIGKQKGISAAEERKRRWAAKKQGVEYIDEGSAAMKELTGLADSLVSRGEMEVYQYTLERVQHLLRQMDHKAVDNVDMFADELESASGDNVSEDKAGIAVKKTDLGSEVMWEYKMSDEDAPEIIGPISSTDMLRMQEDGKFGDGSVARKIGTEAFYSISRLDFELYM